MSLIFAIGFAQSLIAPIFTTGYVFLCANNVALERLRRELKLSTQCFFIDLMRTKVITAGSLRLDDLDRLIDIPLFLREAHLLTNRVVRLERECSIASTYFLP